jgi:prepilin-type N-terminal cleavage/methylation domain-containing protein
MTHRGFTLAEMMVVISIFAAMSIALSYAILQTYRGNAYVFEAASSLDNARRGVNTALENLREASYGEDGSYPIASAATSSVTFYADVDEDGPIEKVRVYLSNGVLYRGVTNATGNPPSYAGQPETVQTVVGYVRNATSTPLFSYYDSSGASLGTTAIDATKVRFVTMGILVDLNPTRAPNVYTLTGSATLRNLRDE